MTAVQVFVFDHEWVPSGYELRVDTDMPSFYDAPGPSGAASARPLLNHRPCSNEEERMRVLVKAAFVVLCLTILPKAAFAQAAIAGTVKDSSGAVLPGVTVEASSPV